MAKKQETLNSVVTTTSTFDVFYISYDEPNAEENWADLQTKIPWAKRVHGVKGFDAAHKACAEQSMTDNFITVDGDNKVNPLFFEQEISFNPEWVYSWGAKNHINGLIYGNGGLKLWPRDLVLNMNTHESATDGEGIEFCWKLPYYQMNDWYSTSYNDTTPFQAFRVGFREGVKTSLHEGKKVKELTSDHMWVGNIKRLKIWLSVGADIENGIYAIYGARLGCYLTNLTDFDVTLIADYDWFNEQWRKEWLPVIDNEQLFKEEYNRLLNDIRNRLHLEVVNLGKNQSAFFKTTVENPAFLGLTVSEKNGETHKRNKMFKE